MSSSQNQSLPKNVSINSNKKTPKHSQHAIDQLDSNCEGCQQQKKQNQKLVDFYNRLEKITNKVQTIKAKNKEIIQNFQNKQQKPQLTLKKCYVNSNQLQQRIKELDQKINVEELPSSTQIKQYDSKDMGFQLAAALIQRQMKYKNENKKLRQKINQLLKEKSSLQIIYENKPNVSIIQNMSMIEKNQKKKLTEEKFERQTMEDSLESLKTQRNKLQKQTNKTRGSSFWQMDTFISKTSKNNEPQLFSTRNQPKFNERYPDENETFCLNKKQSNSTENKNYKKSPYNTEGNYGLNLWLYQFQPQQFQQSLTISPTSSNKLKNFNHMTQKEKSTKQKYKKSSNINKITIIERNLLQNNLSSKNKNKNY